MYDFFKLAKNSKGENIIIYNCYGIIDTTNMKKIASPRKAKTTRICRLHDNLNNKDIYYEISNETKIHNELVIMPILVLKNQSRFGDMDFSCSWNSSEKLSLDEFKKMDIISLAAITDLINKEFETKRIFAYYEIIDGCDEGYCFSNITKIGCVKYRIREKR